MYKKRFFTLFYYFYKNAFFNVFLFFGSFSSGEICYPTIFYITKLAKILLNLLHSCIKLLLSDGFNMAAVKILAWRPTAIKRCHAY